MPHSWEGGRRGRPRWFWFWTPASAAGDSWAALTPKLGRQEKLECGCFVERSRPELGLTTDWGWSDKKTALELWGHRGTESRELGNRDGRTYIAWPEVQLQRVISRPSVVHKRKEIGFGLGLLCIPSDIPLSVAVDLLSWKWVRKAAKMVHIWPSFNSWNPCGRRRKRTSADCPLSSTGEQLPVYTHNQPM